jgi:Right handed beta helix region
MASKRVWLFISMVGLSVLSGSARAGDAGVEEALRRDQTQTGTINLSRDLVRFGIASSNLTPDSPAIDARPLFQAALGFAKNHSIHRITVDHGAYYLLTPQDAQTYLRVLSQSDLTIDLAYSTIYFAGAFLQGFALVNCTNVTLTKFRADFIDPPYTHVRLTQVDPLRRALGYATLPGWADPVTFNALTTPNAVTGPLELWALVFRDGDILPGTSRMHVSQPVANGVLGLIQDNTPWTQSATLSTFNPGDTIVVTARGGLSTISVVGGDKVTVSEATIHGSSAIAVLFNGTTHSIADHVRVMPRPTSGLIASNADGIHFPSSGPDNHIRHSFVTRTVDDALAIDSRDLATVVLQIGPRQVTVDRTAFLRFPNGTAVNFVDPVSAGESSSATIVSQTPPDSNTPVFNGQVSLTFDRDLPALAPGFGMALADPNARGAGSSIEDNVVEDIVFGRGVWIAGAVGVNVARNEIGHTSNGGIVVAQDTTFYPTPAAHDIVVRDNVVRGSLGPMASGTGTQIAVGAIIVESTDNRNLFPISAPNTNVSIERNRIVNSGRSGIWVGQLAGGVIRDNVVIRWNRHPELPFFGVDPQTRAQLLQDFTQPLVIHNSQNVETRHNIFRSDGSADDDAPPLNARR